MKIYTRTGDGGETSFFGGGRAPKSDLRVAAYGDVDELNAHLGAVCVELAAHPVLREHIRNVQRDLFGVGGEVATPGEKARAKLRGLVDASRIQALERSIDEMEGDLEPLRQFILPGGSRGGALLHLARTACRRAERTVVELSLGQDVRAEVLHYLNRLSDWLFVAARWVNRREGEEELPW